MQLAKDDIVVSAEQQGSGQFQCQSALWLCIQHTWQCPMFPVGIIKVYLSAVRHMHICRGLHKYFTQQLTSQLILILTGIKKRQINVHPGRKCLTITIQLFSRIRHLLSKQLSYANTTLCTMCCLAFLRGLILPLMPSLTSRYCSW